MSSGPYLQVFGFSEREDYQKYLYLMSVKTQFSSPETHMLIVNLLRHISTKYLLDFKVSDEGYYWETGDEELLRKTFFRYNELLDMVCNGIQNIPAKSEETIEAYFHRLMEHINKTRKVD